MTAEQDTRIGKGLLATMCAALLLASGSAYAKQAPPLPPTAIATLQLKNSCCYMMDDVTGNWGDAEGMAIEFLPTAIRTFDTLKDRGAPPSLRTLKGFKPMTADQLTRAWFQKTFAELLSDRSKSAEALANFDAARKVMIGQAYFKTEPGMPPYGPDLDLFINTTSGKLFYFTSLSQGQLKSLSPTKPAPPKK